MANKIVVDIASKLLVTLAAGAGALMAKAATEKGLGAAIKKLAERKEDVTEAITAAAENAKEIPAEELKASMSNVTEVIQEAAETIAEEASGA